MQRPGGSADGTDLKKKGLFDKANDQAKPNMKTAIDEKYEKLEKEGKLRSSPFTIPWTAAEAQKLAAAKNAEIKAEKEKLAASSKSKVSKTNASSAVPEEPKKKGFFGLF